MNKSSEYTLNLLSVVIPAYKQEKTILEDLRSIITALDSVGSKYEILLVVDGLVDGTLKNAKKIKAKNIKILGYKENQGKGYAIKYGMLQAKGDIIGFIDAGMDIHPAGLHMLLNHMEWYNADIIVGSKLHPASKVKYPFYRKVLSWGYRLLTAALFGFKVKDTQVGLKFFKKQVIQDVLPRLLVKNYAFDIEILAVAYALGYTRIYEAPVEINFKAGNITISNMIRISYLMLLDTAAVFYRLKIIHYYTKKNNAKTKRMRSVTT